MQLGDLFDDLALDVRTGALEIEDVQDDSRECSEGSLFVAVPGAQRDGIDFAKEAVQRGARAIVAPVNVELGVPVVVVPHSRLGGVLAHLSSTIVDHPENQTQLVGVTGTNGKTSVVSFVASLAQSLGWNGASIGTLTNVRTTPSSPELFRSLRRCVSSFDAQRLDSVVALEVSSHALDQRRVEGLRFHVSAFTNLSHDHLDYHGTLERYFAAKASLFTRELSRRSVIWVDDEYGARLADSVSIPVTRVSRRDVSEVAASFSGTSFFWRGHVVSTQLVGDYNVDNAIVAMSVMSELGVNDSEVARALFDVEPVPGRFNVVQRGGLTVVIDYAHTPAGLERLLSDVRQMNVEGKVWCVFGCGGERDRLKRPRMGQVSSEWADVTVVTSDNPRSESPDAIIDEVLSGILPGSEVVREVDRRRAIELVISRASRGDVVVVAGKGHETTQSFGSLDVAFDDREVVEEFLK